jgi:hypothetical protein
MWRRCAASGGLNVDDAKRPKDRDGARHLARGDGGHREQAHPVTRRRDAEHPERPDLANAGELAGRVGHATS